MKFTSSNLRHWITGSMVAVLVLSLIAWYVTRDHLPATVRLATGAPGGQYHEFGVLFKSIIEKNTSTRVELIPSEGSRQNNQLLQSGKADLMIVQGGSVELTNLTVVAPLYPDVIHVVARTDRSIHQVTDLVGHKVILGSDGSGMRQSATGLLRHYGIRNQIDEADAAYFSALPDDTSIDAAIITSGILNSDLRRILSSGSYQLLPIADAEAIAMGDPYFSTYIIPRGLYGERPPLPGAPISTLATTAFLVAKPSASNALVDALLNAVFESGMRLQMPTLLSRQESRHWLDMPLHPEARRYFDPQDEIGNISAIMESLAATKELLFALAAGIYLLWERWRRLNEKELQAALRDEKDHLDELLAKTVAIEARQIGVTDEKVLRGMLDDVTRIKLQALEELTHEELRGDRSFLIFLTQCSSLINKIQAKIGTDQASRPKLAYLTALGMIGGVAAWTLQERRQRTGTKKIWTDCDSAL